jgi:hypothetical protein
MAHVDPQGEQPGTDHEGCEKVRHAPDPDASTPLDSSSQWWFMTVLDRARGS